jgi:hypothetical protein
MSDELKDILSNLNPGTEQDKLLQYINRKLTDEEKHALEKNMANDEFMNDAVEGLEQVNNPAEIQDIVNRLNSKLREQVRSDKQKRHQRKPGIQSWLYISIVLIILLAVISYFVIRKIQGA